MATVRTLIGNIKGPKGDTGATGATGPQGPGATIEVGTVSTTAYGNPVQITNSGTETDAVLDFVIPQGKPGEQTTKMSGLTLDTITTQTTEYPIPAVGDVGSTAWGKIVKFFNDIKTAVTGKVDTTSIVNNLTSTSTDKPLSAAQGKALNDALGNIGTIASTNTESTSLSIAPNTWQNVNMMYLPEGTWLVFARFVAGSNQTAIVNKRIVGCISSGVNTVDIETDGGATGRINFTVSKIMTVTGRTAIYSKILHDGSSAITLARESSPEFGPTSAAASCIFAFRIK